MRRHDLSLLSLALISTALLLLACLATGLPVGAQLEAELRLRRDAGLAEAVVLEPIGIAHLNEPGRRMAQEQQLLIAEAELEVGEEGRLSAGDVVGVVHETARFRFVL